MTKSVRGFTLVELLIVISIIAILSVIGITVFSGIQKNARDAKRRADIDSIAKAFEVKYNNTGSYGSTQIEGTYFASGLIPKDPRQEDYTIYKDTASGGIKVCASLDNNTSFCKSGAQEESPKDGATTTILVAGPGVSGSGGGTTGGGGTGGSGGSGPSGPFTALYNDNSNFWVNDGGNWAGSTAEALIPDSQRRSESVSDTSSPVHSPSGSVKMAVNPAINGCCHYISPRHDYGSTSWSAYKWLTLWWYGKNTGVTVTFVIQTGDVNPWDSGFDCNFKDDVLDNWKQVTFNLLDATSCPKHDKGADLANLNKIKRIFMSVDATTLPASATSFNWYWDDVQLSP